MGQQHIRRQDISRNATKIGNKRIHVENHNNYNNNHAINTTLNPSTPFFFLLLKYEIKVKPQKLAVRKAVLNRIPYQKWSILETNAGMGYTAEILQYGKYFRNHTMVEMDPSMAQSLREKYPSATIICGDNTQVSYTGMANEVVDFDAYAQPYPSMHKYLHDCKIPPKIIIATDGTYRWMMQSRDTLRYERIQHMCDKFGYVYPPKKWPIRTLTTWLTESHMKKVLLQYGLHGETILKTVQGGKNTYVAMYVK